VAAHAKNTLRRPSVAQIFNLPLAIPASKAGGAKGLVARENCKIFDLVAAGAAAISAIVANQGTITKKE
jgi:hypothetical protein